MAPRRLPVSLIVACSVNRVIGKQGKLPWDLPADWAFFSSATRNQVLVVGRRSFEEFDAPIPNRHTIVVSSTLQRPTQAQGDAVGGRWTRVQVARTLEQALQLAVSHPQYQLCTRVFVGGGERLYQEAMEAGVAESCYVSRVQRHVVGGDAFFPKWTSQFPKLMYSAKTNGGGSTRVSFEIWSAGQTSSQP
ncbi:dihydrofolate reductase [Phytophthora pseudosyringae]|uniref:Bifunctional dihydrofolate reductase-thymidylate synthase n=1 Tax=Phytophthora pseudosyringae TaxID=221518 RepID=A0A8T1VB50_9STRA|nr:dihydrofolate reductase [Phytophthora pseudosyringae]